MALDIAQLKAAFAKKSEATGDGGNTGFWDKFYPFYKMDFEQVVTFRFLPDLNEDNPLGFIVENKYHELMVNGKKKKIACLKMFGETSCPCCENSKKYYDAGDTRLGKMFWRKIDYIAQGIIVNSPFEYEMKADENPVRLISIGPKLYTKIENAIVQGDLDSMPYDMEEGYDFRIMKSKQGEYADYSNSDFARKATPINPNVAEKIDLYDLSNYRFARVEREQMEVMIDAALTGKALEDAPASNAPSNNTGNANLDSKMESPKETQSAASVVNAAASAAPASTGGSKPSPAEILARLKNRAK